MERKSAFKASRLTASTFLIVEHDDSYDEQPHIYVKLLPQARKILVIDTGCGGASNDPKVEIKSLKEFIETVHVKDNDNKPLNENGSLSYIVVLSHIHYDHILGIEQFKGFPILVSSHDAEFISPENRPIHSLCQHLGIATPCYTGTPVAHLHSVVGVTIIHTPGHTPDELALYDASEKMLYVGDSLYEDAPIIFPKEGSIIEWISSMEALISFVKLEQKKHDTRILINAGHCTALRPALEVLQAAMDFMQDVINGTERIRKRTTVRGELTVSYAQQNGRFSLRCPQRLVEEVALKPGK
ncbi:Metallo-hydrolase/oxidoreductase [Mycena floridula]|nr:Metallo-hydrolase/oxidoreductase [Mycena floridula]